MLISTTQDFCAYVSKLLSLGKKGVMSVSATFRFETDLEARPVRSNRRGALFLPLLTGWS